jgi:aerobic carbon-monoxide dehydrogenase medium subunit
LSYTTLEDFEYSQPRSLSEALSLASKFGSGARYIAGGTDLIVLMMRRKLNPNYVISLGKIKELNFIAYNKERGLDVGALCSLRSIERAEGVRQNYPALFEAVRLVGSVQIRNMATIGGNLCNASPAADTAPPLLAFDVRLTAANEDGKRSIPIGEFFLGPGRTALRPGEILTGVHFDPPSGGTRSAFGKLGRTPTDISKVSAAVMLRSHRGVCEEVRIALGAVASTPIRTKGAEGLLQGQQISNELVEKVARRSSEEARPIDDIRSTARWRKEAIKYLVRSLLQKLSGLA